MPVAVGVIALKRLLFLDEHAKADLVARSKELCGALDFSVGFLPLALLERLDEKLHFAHGLLLLGGGQQHFGFDQHQMRGHRGKLAISTSMRFISSR